MGVKQMSVIYIGLKMGREAWPRPEGMLKKKVYVSGHSLKSPNTPLNMCAYQTQSNQSGQATGLRVPN